MIQETETVVQDSVKLKPNVFVWPVPVSALVSLCIQEFVPELYGCIFGLRKYIHGTGSYLQHLQVFLLGGFPLTPLEMNNTPISQVRNLVQE